MKITLCESEYLGCQTYSAMENKIIHELDIDFLPEDPDKLIELFSMHTELDLTGCDCEMYNVDCVYILVSALNNDHYFITY